MRALYVENSCIHLILDFILKYFLNNFPKPVGSNRQFFSSDFFQEDNKKNIHAHSRPYTRWAEMSSVMSVTFNGYPTMPFGTFGCIALHCIVLYCIVLYCVLLCSTPHAKMNKTIDIWNRRGPGCYFLKRCLFSYYKSHHSKVCFRNWLAVSTDAHILR
jgi:hypothetical protein